MRVLWVAGTSWAGRDSWRHSATKPTAIVAADLPYARELWMMELSRACGQLAHAQVLISPPTAGSSLGHKSDRMLLPCDLLTLHPCPHQVARMSISI